MAVGVKAVVDGAAHPIGEAGQTAGCIIIVADTAAARQAHARALVGVIIAVVDRPLRPRNAGNASSSYKAFTID